MLEREDLDSAMMEADKHNTRNHTKQADAEADQRKKIQQPDAKGRNKDVGGNMGEEEHEAGVPNGTAGDEQAAPKSEDTGFFSQHDPDKGFLLCPLCSY